MEKVFSSSFTVAVSILITQAKSLKNVKCEDKHSDDEKLTKLKTFVTDYVRIYRTVNPSKRGGGVAAVWLPFKLTKIIDAQDRHPFHFYFSSSS